MTGRTRPVLKSRFPLRAFLLLSGVTLVPAAFALRSPAAWPAAAEAVRPHLAQAQDVNLDRRLYEQRCASCHGLPNPQAAKSNRTQRPGTHFVSRLTEPQCPSPRKGRANQPGLEPAVAPGCLRGGS